jgi:NAD(P)-dependent dehydrogenase (short-subunit alcohol dehydrogenase family)
MKPVKDLFDLHGTRALVTGAGGNIGGAVARRLAEAGASVALHYHTSVDAAERLREEIGANAMAVQADISTDQGVRDMFADLQDASFEVNAVVLNAADQTVANLQDITPKQWRQMMATNLDSAFLICQTAISLMPGGSIVNISSIEGADPAPGHGHYATSKAGLNMLSRAFALESGEHGVRINTVSPGLIRRDGIEQAWPEGVSRWQSRAPLSRLGEAGDVADACLFLLSDAARWISGANLVVDGGMSAQGRW